MSRAQTKDDRGEATRTSGPRARRVAFGGTLLAGLVVSALVLPVTAVGAPDPQGPSIARPGASTTLTGGGARNPAPEGFRALLDRAIGPFSDASGDQAPDIRSNSFRFDDLNPGITTDDRIAFQTTLGSPSVFRVGDEVRYEFDIDANRGTGSPSGGEVGVSIFGFEGFDRVSTVHFDGDGWVIDDTVFETLAGQGFNTAAIDFFVLRDVIGVPRGSTPGIIVRTFDDAGFADVSPEQNSFPLPIDATPLKPTAAVFGSIAAASSTTATFGGEVNPGGVPTTYRFQYGTSTAYGSETTPASAGAGRTPVVVSQAVSGLAPGSVYHWRLVASSAAGESASADQVVTTIPNPPTAATARALSTGARSVRLTGVADTNGGPGTAFFEYGRTTKFGSRTAGVPVNGSAAKVSVDLRGLKRDSVYFYRLVVDTVGGRGVGRNLSVRTGEQNQVVAEVDAQLAGAGGLFLVPRFRVNIRIVGPTNRIITASAALKRVRVHVLCTRGCKVNGHFSLAQRSARLTTAGGSAVTFPISVRARGASIDLSRLFASGGSQYRFAQGSEIQLRLSGAGLRGSASVITLKSVPRRLRCGLNGGRPINCRIPS